MALVATAQSKEETEGVQRGGGWGKGPTAGAIRSFPRGCATLEPGSAPHLHVSHPALEPARQTDQAVALRQCNHGGVVRRGAHRRRQRTERAAADVAPPAGTVVDAPAGKGAGRRGGGAGSGGGRGEEA
eukprot:scaffold20199_cov51-Isochrysis_galbana.AAC.1